MKEDQTTDVALSFSVYHGGDSCGVEIAARSDHDAPPQQLDNDAEAYWAGRYPAARISARVAA